jgi:D-beta-D-heptose 7-phosphate kinase/D-beta-D-heptose 1-phosphate adenosyltransferase
MPAAALSSARQLQSAIARMRRRRILVIGDVMLDRFVRGKVTRISPEAPVPVVHVTGETAHVGGAANVARNLAEFGIRASVCGIIGDDTAGRELAALLRQGGIDTRGLVTEPSIPTIVKTRIFARQQQVVRVDWEQPLTLAPRRLAALQAHLRRAIPAHDAVILEDYGKGLLTQELYDFIAATAAWAGKPVAVDPNIHNLLDYAGATVLKPNRLEAAAAAGLSSLDSLPAAAAAGASLARRWSLPLVLLTLGEEGMLLFQEGTKPFHTPTRAREVFDVSGAGDTVIAFFTAALAAGLVPTAAAELANHAAGVVVGKLGTATVSPAELLEHFRRDD